MFQKGVEGLYLIEEQTIIHHVLVVDRQLGQSPIIVNQAKTARDSGVIVDRFAIGALLREEDTLMIGHRLCQGGIRDCRVDEAGSIEPRHIMPMTRKPVTAS